VAKLPNTAAIILQTVAKLPNTASIILRSAPSGISRHNACTFSGYPFIGFGNVSPVIFFMRFVRIQRYILQTYASELFFVVGVAFRSLSVAQMLPVT